MHKLRKGRLKTLAALTGLITISCCGSVVARQNIIVGSIGAGYTYLEREYDNETAEVEENAGDRREYAVWPEIEFQSLAEHNSLFLNYSPRMTYNELDSETDLDHYLELTWEQQLSRRWSFSFLDDFVYSTDPERYTSTFDTEAEEDTTGEQIDPAAGLSQNLGARRFWTNNLQLLTSYNYAEESGTEFEYGYRVLRNDSGTTGTVDYDEYDRHGIAGRWAHRYSPSWRSEMGLRYITGIFAEDSPEGLSQDVTEYRVDLQADYVARPSNFFPVIYRYQRAEYEDLREDVWGNELSIGWDYTADRRNYLAVGAGPSYVKSSDLDGEFGFNAYFNYIRSYQFGRFEASANKRYVSRNFSGTSDSGFTDVTDLRLDGSYQLSPSLSADAFGLYRFEEILNPQGEYSDAASGDPDLEASVGDVTYTRKGFSTGVGLNYSFFRWYTTSLSYVYSKQEGDVGADSYEDHRVVLQLTWSQELWR